MNKLLEFKSKSLLIGYLILVIFILLLALRAWRLDDMPTFWVALGTPVFSLSMLLVVEQS